ncbi:MAG: glutamine synthetase III [Candidatus Aminicenantes bacterium]|nr:MAG: glutamine synthetase III [Candidatus Aminicenantes bacterium]
MQSHFATHVFGVDKMEERLPPHVFKKFKKTVDEKKSLDSDVADAIATEIKKWAESLGVTHYTHWFLPLTGLTAGKQNTFLDRDEKRNVISKFSGRELIKGEPDASSFPHGGMRSTFEARGYTAWDPLSPVFIGKREKGCILYIPSVFFGYNGEVLDKKTPLLRSLKLINEISLKLLRKFNRKVNWVKNMAGAEQEFFLVNREDYHQRPDLKTLGRILFAARPPRGQQMGDHYFGAIPEKVLQFLEDVEEEALKLGIPIKTRHNEVAPNQFEMAPIYEEANISADHNQMLMDLLTNTARRHSMACLLHEKPFSFFNGSGKHLNWSLMDSNYKNLLTSGDSKASKFIFLSFLAGFIVGINCHNDLIQSVLSSPGNELRLGGHEAPPSIISIYLGEELQGILKNLDDFVSGKARKTTVIRIEAFVPPILHDMSDRNRTSPVAFTGNKFEFRMPGSSASLAFPIAAINLAVVDGLNKVYQYISPWDDDKKILEALNQLIHEHSAIIFEGDNYDEAWRNEAKKRGIFIPVSLPQTIDQLKHKKNISLFAAYNILNKDEIEARADIQMEMYVKTIEMELRVARHLLRAYIIPAALKNQKLLLDAVNGFPAEVLKKEPSILDRQREFIRKFTQKIDNAMKMLSILDEDNEKLKQRSDREKADLCCQTIRPHIFETAALVEKIEERVDKGFWEMPRIIDILFR